MTSSESCFDHLHLRKASFHGGSSYRNQQANVCYDAQVREHCYEHAVRGIPSVVPSCPPWAVERCICDTFSIPK